MLAPRLPLPTAHASRRSPLPASAPQPPTWTPSSTSCWPTNWFTSCCPTPSPSPRTCRVGGGAGGGGGAAARGSRAGRGRGGGCALSACHPTCPNTCRPPRRHPPTRCRAGMPTLCRPVYEGGVGFDYRLAMGGCGWVVPACLPALLPPVHAPLHRSPPAPAHASQPAPRAPLHLTHLTPWPSPSSTHAGLPDYWIELLKHVRDEDWSMSALVARLCDRCGAGWLAGVRGPAAVLGALRVHSRTQ